MVDFFIKNGINDFIGVPDSTLKHFISYLIKKNKIVLPTDDEVIKQYDIILEKMLEMDYENYEISNFSKRGFISKHNSNYWTNEKYIGYGPGAHSYDKENRYLNINDN